MDDDATPDPAYPLTLRVTGRRCVVIGAGHVGTRRALALVRAGADVTVVSPAASSDVRDASDRGELTWIERPYAPGDLTDAWLAHTTTGDPAVDAAVAAESDAARVWLIRSDDRTLSDAWMPAVARADDVTVAVSAGGDPRRAMEVRDTIAFLLRDGTVSAPRHRAPAAPVPSPLSATPPTAPVPAPPGVGSVALVGGGPGDPGLLTLRAVELLAQADVVVIDRLAPRSALTHARADVEVIDVGKHAGTHPVPQEAINALLVEQALAGRRVVRLKGGDPYVFGRGGEELDACTAAGVPVDVVPGVTSAIAVLAAAGIPVTHRGLSRGFTVLTGHDDLGTVPQAPDHTLVLLMGLGRLGTTADELIARGRDARTPAAILEDGFGPRARTTVATLGTLAEAARSADVRAPAITVIGPVVTRAPEWVAHS
ncbi:uroporphyrinogen-III C-methyltransferase [Sanguibacter sp. A247]|uniref:uroporphyrinogen-III C-methyltransferase n=1 Tax=unclassified Sanguibacter TaxID=2645534 RepID=UPI003FD87ABC